MPRICRNECVGSRSWGRGGGQEIGDGVVEAVWVDGVPGAEEDDVAHEDLVLEGSAKVPLRLGERFLDLAPDAGDGAHGGAVELGDLEGGAEHVSDEGGVAEDFVGGAG